MKSLRKSKGENILDIDLGNSFWIRYENRRRQIEIKNRTT